MRGWTKLSLVVLPIVAGCTPNDPTLGGSVRTVYAQQVINPEPQQQTDQIEGSDGQRSAAAVDRYRKGSVKQPRSIRTTSGIGGGGSGGNGGGGSGL